MEHSAETPQESMNTQVLRDRKGELKHFCYPLVDPRWISVDDAAHMLPADPVLGLAFDGRSWALPWWIMKNHHMANLVLNGRHVFVALCEACTTASAYDPVIEGRPYTFRLDAMYNGTIMAVDHQTGSRWPGPTGQAIEGPLKGRVMERLPMLLCTWQEWVELHPDTSVPDGQGDSREGHGEWDAPGGPFVGGAMIKTLLRKPDRRLPHCELVLGVMAGGESRCYPLAALAGHGRVMNDTLGGEEIAVFSRPGSWLASAYQRYIDGRCLTFHTEGDTIVDEESGSRWEISGMAVGGPLQGRQLRYVYSGVEEFFIWAAFHPETRIFGQGSLEDPAAQREHPGWSLKMFEALKQVVIGNNVRSSTTERGAWWHRDMRLLDIGCGDGVFAAWFAEEGLDVLGVDRDPECIARARESFRGVRRLTFEAMDVRHPMTFEQLFDALVDYRCLARLAAAERPAYVSNVAAVAKPGARFLLLLPAPGEARMQQLAHNVRRLFAPSFELLDAKITPFPHPATGAETRGAAFRFMRC